MRIPPLLCVLALPIAIAQATPDIAAAESRDAFARIAALAGQWRSTQSARDVRVDIRVIAGGYAVVETWTMAPSRVSMTVYAMDGDRLVATHYCPQGNAPRLRLEGIDADATLRFAFVDGLNLDVADREHEHAFSVHVDAPDRFTRTETYVPNGDLRAGTGLPASTSVFVRER